MRAGKVAWHFGLLLAFGATRIVAQAPDQDPGGHDHMMMADARHLRLTPQWPERPGDMERADSVTELARQALARYEDVTIAEADGYHMFAARIKKQGVYHYSNRQNAVRARREFDVTRPSALLYQPQRDGSLRLIGAMYTAPPDFSLDQLDERLPLSIAQWHQHTSICLPPGSQLRGAGDEMGSARMDSRFGPRGSINTKEECDSAGGVFLPRMFGWMVHVNMFLGGEEVWVHKH
jgi:hypothetical protein